MIREILRLHHTYTNIGYTRDQLIVWALNRQYLDEIERTQAWETGSRPTCEVTQRARPQSFR